MRLHIHEDQIIKRTMWFYTLRRHNLIQLKKYCIFGLLPGKIFRQTFYFRKILLQKKIRLEISEGVLGNSFSLVCLWWLVFAIWTPLAKNCQIRSQLLKSRPYRFHNSWVIDHRQYRGRGERNDTRCNSLLNARWISVGYSIKAKSPKKWPWVIHFQ